MSRHGVDLDRAGPSNDNRPDLMQRARQPGGKGKETGMVLPRGASMPARECHFPQATGLPGSLMIIENAGHGGHRSQGIPGILHTTTLGPEQRSRLMNGIIDLGEHAREMGGPVHSITGHDATAMNAGMRPIPGAPIHGDSHGKSHHMDGVIDDRHSGMKKSARRG